ncbi:MAG: hypothetical protein HC812_17220 [Leptolyngbya sp. RL_3_1]|nr:hypothetical protein [Leptolyngbya sp. RL_3_1]
MVPVLGCAQNPGEVSPQGRSNSALANTTAPDLETSHESIPVSFRVYTLDHQPLENVAAQMMASGAVISNPFTLAQPESGQPNTRFSAINGAPHSTDRIGYTDNTGYVSLVIPKGRTVEVEFSRQGFQPKTQSLYLQARRDQPLLIYLQAESAPSEDASTTSAPRSAPTQFVQEYYENLNAKKVGRAWQMLQRQLQRQHTAYSLFYSRWSRVEQVQIQTLKLISQGNGWAVVEAKVTHWVNDQPRQIAPQRFTLDWDQAEAGWKIARVEDWE